jgi:hypothetical protein
VSARNACLATLSLVLLAVPNGVARGSADALGVPLGGPDVLYAPAPDLPQLQNRDPRFRAPYSLISGTERYVGGEYSYTDFVYDDEGSAYPDDWKRYAGNAADLFEFRLATPAEGGLAVRFSLTTLVAEDSTIAAVAFDTDNSAKTGSATLARDPGMPFPGTDAVLTTWGTGAEWSTWTGAKWAAVPLDAKVDLDANQITVTVPKSVADPRGEWRATLAVGLFDPATKGWLSPPPAEINTGLLGRLPAPPGSAPSPKIFNLGFRFNEFGPLPTEQVHPDAAPFTKQAAALSAGSPTTFAHPIDFDLLRRGGARDNIPKHGLMFRVFPSRAKSVEVVPGGGFGSVINRVTANPPAGRQESEGKQRASGTAQYLSPLQPYAIYVPSKYDGSRPTPLTFFLHGFGNEYWALYDAFMPIYLGEQRNSIVVTPATRGGEGWYMGENEYDVFELWNDVARHYSLDSQRTAMTGFSMGGYGAYRLALLNPHLFARAAMIAPPLAAPFYEPGVNQLRNDPTVVNNWIENARNLPIFELSDALSELTIYPAHVLSVAGPAVPPLGMQSLESLGYEYKWWSVVADHIAIGTDHPAMGPFLAQHTIEPAPFHVTFARMPSSDVPSRDLRHNRAYWLSGIEVRDGSSPVAKGVVDAVSHGFGKADPSSTLHTEAGTTTAFGLPYVGVERTARTPQSVSVANRISLKLTNIASVTIDPKAARVGCNAKVVVDSDGPVDVSLLGCPKAASGVAGGEASGDAPSRTGPSSLPRTGADAHLPLALVSVAVVLRALRRLVPAHDEAYR